MSQDRKYYIDNLRWLWIALLVPFHTAMAWNGWEGNYIWLSENKILSALVIFISPWYMPLLFVLAGMSTRYAMKRRSYGQFVLERVQKLLIPLIAGVLTVVALMTFVADKYHNAYAGGFFDHYGIFFTNFTDLTGYDGAFTPGHLWFVLFLFIISMISLPIIALQKKVLSKLSFTGIRMFLLPLLVLIPLALKPLLDFNGKSIGENLALFLIGYYILSEEDVMERMTKYRYAYLAIMLIFDITLNYSFVWKGNPIGILETICIQGASWFGILGFLGLARCILNQNNAFTRYMSSRSFMFYIFHFGWLVILQYNLCKVTASTIIIFFVSSAGTYVLTLVTCEIVRRIPGVRLLFGGKAQRLRFAGKGVTQRIE